MGRLCYRSGMAAGDRGVVAAGHPLTAEAGARVLREGGNAVDAAVAAMLMSFAAEPLLTGLGAGGYMLVAGGGQDHSLLDFFAPATARRPPWRRSTCPSATPPRCSTSARPRVACMARRRACARRCAAGARC